MQMKKPQKAKGVGGKMDEGKKERAKRTHGLDKMQDEYSLYNTLSWTENKEEQTGVEVEKRRSVGVEGGRGIG